VCVSIGISCLEKRRYNFLLDRDDQLSADRLKALIIAAASARGVFAPAWAFWFCCIPSLAGGLGPVPAAVWSIAGFSPPLGDRGDLPLVGQLAVPSSSASEAASGFRIVHNLGPSIRFAVFAMGAVGFREKGMPEIIKSGAAAATAGRVC